MSLSIEKLQTLLRRLGYVDIKYYINDGLCFFVELFALKTSDVFLLYIPSKYKFKMNESDNAYKVKFIDMENKAEENPEAVYGDSIRLPPNKKENMNDHLEVNYKHDINLSDISKEDNIEILSIYKQLKRLKYCIQNINYKIGITYKNYFCAIRRDDSIECYIVKHHPRDSNKKLYVLTDLEMLYTNADQLDYDISTVRNELYKVLEKNQGLHTKVIDTIMESKSDVFAIANKMKDKRILFENYTNRLQNMLNGLIKVEEEKQDDIKRLAHPSPHNTFANDMDAVNAKSKLEADIYEIVALKTEISKYLSLIKTQREDILLNVDNVLFDNNVAFDSMTKNFTKLKKFLD